MATEQSAKSVPDEDDVKEDCFTESIICSNEKTQSLETEEEIDSEQSSKDMSNEDNTKTDSFTEPLTCSNKEMQSRETEPTDHEFKAPVGFKLPPGKLRNSQTTTMNQTSNSQTVKNNHARPSNDRGQSEIPYVQPSWGGTCEQQYSFDVLKNGKIIENIQISNKTYHVFGRLKNCDIPMDHPSISRYHAVLQHCNVKAGNRDIGWYLYDLGSTHGTLINKRKIDPRIYVRLRVGYMIKFGGSSRLFILQGPCEDREEESNLTITEMKKKLSLDKMEAELLKKEKEASEEKQDTDQDGCSWGMDGFDAEDAEIDPDAPNPFSLDSANGELNLDDPKKTLRGYFEREGLDMPEYEAVEVGYGKHKCTVELPLDDSNGMPIVAEATVTGKKKESVIACALEACRILDRHGELRKSTHASREKKKKDWAENDFYDSDDDTFLDRTGDIERKRQQRMKRSNKEKSNVLTYDTIKSQMHEIEKELHDIQSKLDKAASDSKSKDTEGGGLDALDAFMESIKSGAMDTKTKMSLKRRMFELKREQAKLEKLADVARPTNVPAVKPKLSSSVLPIIGKRKIPAKSTILGKVPAKPSPVVTKQTMLENDEEEEEEECDTAEVEKNRMLGQDSTLDTTKKTVTCIDEENEENEEISVNGSSLKTVEFSPKNTNLVCEQSKVTERTDSLDNGMHSMAEGDSEKLQTVVDQTHISSTNSETHLRSAMESMVEVNKRVISKVNCEEKLLKGPHMPPPFHKVEEHHKQENKDSTDYARQNEQLEVESVNNVMENKIIKGASLPSLDVSKGDKVTREKETTEAGDPEFKIDAPPTKKRRARDRRKQKTETKESSPYNSTDPDYAVWLPPQDQSGDGKTHLNAKFGY